MSMIDIAAATLDHISNLEKTTPIRPNEGKFDVFNEEGKVIKTFDTWDEAHGYAKSHIDELMNNPEKLDLFGSLIREGKDKDATLSSNEQESEWYKQIHKEAYDKLKGKNEHLIIKTRDELIQTLKDAGLDKKWIDVYMNARDMLNNNIGYIKTIAARGGVELVDSGSDYWPGISTSYIKDMMTFNDINQYLDS